MTSRRWNAIAAALAGSLLAAGCTHLGPRTVALDRFDYGAAIADSWKDQTLLNIVKLRYADMPVFLDVSSIVAGYSLQTGVTLNGVLSSRGGVQGDYGAIQGQGIYTDRPTITYAPMTGEKFLNGLITPIEPRNIFFMLQAGYPADFILALTVESLNGVRNRSALGGTLREADPAFVRALQLLRDVQAAGGLGMRVEEDKAKGSAAILLFRREGLPADIEQKGAEIRRLLQMSADEQKFSLLYSPMRGGANELAVNSRSMLQILQAFSTYVDVPEQHLRELRAFKSVDENASPDQYRTGRILSGTTRPEGAFAAVRYRDHWFWVPDNDLQTKRALTAIMFVFTLTGSASPERLPLVTIPAQ